MPNPLRQWRADRNLSQSELGDLIGVDGMTVSRWERGGHLPRKKHRQKIQEVTGIAPSELFNSLSEAEPAQ